MKRIVLTATAAALFAMGAPIHANAGGRFDSKLPKDQQIVHALNRLTFGPRPGDAETVRRMGVVKWIELQLHPERIPENPALEAKLKPLESLRMGPAEVFKRYPAFAPGLAPRFTALNEILSEDQTRRILNGTPAERQAALAAVSPQERRKVLAAVPPEVLSTPELQKEAEDARKAQQQERQKEIRRLLPPLPDLLNADQIWIAQRGTTEEREALFASLDPVKRQQVAGALGPQAMAGFPELRRLGMVSRQPQQIVISDLREGKLYRALYSNRQLEEILVDFWFNHFNVYEAKGLDRMMLASYERDAIRPHVFGHFKDLLLATARHPAMLLYLDNWESMSPDALQALQVGPFASVPNLPQMLGRQARGLNENYGRELMELHTLGVNGGYTQQDVIAVARCFTGWTIRQPNVNPQFQFAAFMHDIQEKTVLGHRIAAGGEQDGLEVIDILAHHPSTAKFISKKLAQHFVADDPPQSLVDRMARTFTNTDGDLRAVLETLFTSREFFSEGAWQAKIKTPFEMVVSAVRATQADATDTFALAQKIADLGQPLYSKIEPTGYPDSGEAWLSTVGLLGRINFASALSAGQIPGVKFDGSWLDGKDPTMAARALLNRDASPETQAAIENGLRGRHTTPALVTGLVISSPDFQRR